MSTFDKNGTSGIKVTPIVDGEDANVEVEVFLKNYKEGQSLCYSIMDAEGKEVASMTASEKKVQFCIEDVHLWNGKKDPYLYSAKVELVENETVLDIGCLSLNSKAANVLAVPQGKMYFMNLMGKLMPPAEEGGMKVDESMFDILSGFTMLRFMNMASSNLKIDFSKEELLNVNAELNQISCL